MAQQINLHRPILLTTRRYFSALAMAQALGLIALGTLALSGWTAVQNRTLRTELQTIERQRNAEKQMLMNAIAANPALNTNTTALEQSFKTLQLSVAQRQQTLEELKAGLVIDGKSHSARLKLVAQTVPAPVWLSDVRLAGHRLEVIGMTLEPAALKPWIARLAGDPLLAELPLDRVQVQRAAKPANLEAWAFTLGSAGEPLGPPGAAEPSFEQRIPHATALADTAIAARRADAARTAEAASGASR